MKIPDLNGGNFLRVSLCIKSLIGPHDKPPPLAFLPLSHTETSVVYSINKSDFIKKEKFIELINYHNSKYDIKEIIKISSFQLNFINLRSYYYKNILAFGDLIHKIHPLAGQGFNMTIRDIKAINI